MTADARIRLRPQQGAEGISQARSALAALVEVHSVPRRAAQHVHVALDELLSNVMNHSSVGPEDVVLTIRADRLSLTVRDAGPPFDPTEPPFPDPAQRPHLGGRGLDLVRRLADELTYRRADDINEVTFIKTYIPCKEAAVTQGLTIIEDRVGDTATVALEGRIDSGNAGALTRHLTDLTEAGHRHIIIDFAKLDYLTSAGFRTLLIASDAAEELGGGLRLRNLSEDVRELFELSGLLGAFAVEDA